MTQWKDAVLSLLAVNNAYKKEHENDPLLALQTLLDQTLKKSQESQKKATRDLERELELVTNDAERYKAILDACANVFGQEAYVADNGSAKDKPDYLRIPHLVAKQRLRFIWAANELLACDYGDNDHPEKKIGWRVYGWRFFRNSIDRRIYGSTVREAVDNELVARGVLNVKSKC